MEFSINNWLKLFPVLILTTLLFSTASLAKDKLSLSEKADAADKLSQDLESEQLQKAREAARDTKVRERKILKRQESGDWETEQIEKAQKQFHERESRQDKYLREAKEAAAKERKIPKP
ncbi:hypothetical protein [Shewanella woodyi]|uniref:hypothetical protein n=1 Tax=Shewanella woodyi TaxID=60961 RepID=UPI0007F86909|nr:hypothetical protein [Shewanella woodyi]